jgi:hypothetical protein
MLLRTPTVCLYNAVYLDPNNKKYIDTLCEVYDKQWKNMQISDNGFIAEDFRHIRKRAKAMVEKYRN